VVLLVKSFFCGPNFAQTPDFCSNCRAVRSHTKRDIFEFSPRTGVGGHFVMVSFCDVYEALPGPSGRPHEGRLSSEGRIMPVVLCTMLCTSICTAVHFHVNSVVPFHAETFVNPLVAIFVHLSEILGSRRRPLGSTQGSAAQVWHKSRASLHADAAPSICTFSENTVRVGSAQVWHKLGILERNGHRSLRTRPCARGRYSRLDGHFPLEVPAACTLARLPL
jgi:hypothetical protein